MMLRFIGQSSPWISYQAERVRFRKSWGRLDQRSAGITPPRQLNLPRPSARNDLAKDSAASRQVGSLSSSLFILETGLLFGDVSAQEVTQVWERAERTRAMS